MKSHTLAKLLLTLPNLPVTTHAMGHDTLPSNKYHVGLMTSYEGQSIHIGNFSKDDLDLNPPNWSLDKVYR